jgi:GDP-4-dehydro-6-deoxy-D-mannose reductase
MRILITGITGFAGGHLAETLADRSGSELIGVNRHSDWPAPLSHLAKCVRLIRCELSETTAVERVLREACPDQIYHLAGFANTGRSFREPDQAWVGNFGVSKSLYDAIIRWGGKPKVVFVGSGLIYGETSSPEHRLNEEQPFRPASPYATSKAAADLLSYQVTRTAGLHVVRVRPFNHTGPRQSPDFAVPHFAKQIAAIERGLQSPVLEAGNLAAMRDLSDVRDVVSAYVALMDRGNSGEAYNVASSRTRTIGSALEHLLSLAKVSIEVRQKIDPARSAETAVACGDARKLTRETGWQPRIPIEQTLSDTLEYWRQQP